MRFCSKKLSRQRSFIKRSFHLRSILLICLFLSLPSSKAKAEEHHVVNCKVLTSNSSIPVSLPTAKLSGNLSATELQEAICPSELAKKETTLKHVPGMLIIKLNDSLVQNASSLKETRSSKKRMQMLNVIPSISALNNKYNAQNAKALLAPVNQQNTAASQLIQDSSTAPRSSLSNMFKIKIDENVDVLKAAREYSALNEVAFAEPIILYSSSFVPNDSRYDEQWSHQLTQAEAAWDITRGSSKVKIAIVDTGVDYTHEDFEGNAVADCSDGCPETMGYDFVDLDAETFSWCKDADCSTPDNDPMDFQGHGTHCAGIVAATGNNSKGVSGICPNCTIMPVRAGFSTGYGGLLENDDIANAIVYAADNGADIISMSFGGGQSTVITEAINYAAAKGVILIAAAGNSFSAEPSYPAGFDNVISVAATGPTNEHSYYTNYGYSVDIAAPGGDRKKSGQILSTVPAEGDSADPSGYRAFQGTSMAAPYLAGVVGLMLSNNPSLSPAEVREILSQAVDFPVDGGKYIGAGRINSLKALKLAPVSLQAEITSPLNEEIVDEELSIIGTSSAGSLSFSIGKGIYPSSWTYLGEGRSGTDTVLGSFDVSTISEGLHTIKMEVKSGVMQKSAFVRVRKMNDLHTGWPKKLPGNVRSLLVDDLNFDGEPELIAAAETVTSNGVPETTIAVFNEKGEMLSGWPQKHIGWQGCLVVGNIDDDDSKEIIVTGQTTAAYNYDGSLVATYQHQVPEWVSSCPVIADLNRDGLNEIVVKSGLPTSTFGGDDSYHGKLYVLNSDGSIQSNWPKELGEHVLADPAVGDIDGDGDLEILQHAGISGKLHVFQHDGTYYPGWPRILNGAFTAISSITIADLEHDGLNEIILASSDQIFVLDYRGRTRPGWPATIEALPGNRSIIEIRYSWSKDDGQTWEEIYTTLWRFPGSAVITPIVSDMTGDGNLEVVMGSSLFSKAMILRRDGTRLRSIEMSNDGSAYLERRGASPVIGDIDGDNKMDLIQIPMHLERAFAWNFDGSVKESWPRIFGENHYPGPLGSPILADLDSDGRLEVGMGISNGQIFVWNTSGPANLTSVSWGMRQYDSENSGIFSSPEDQCPSNPQKTKGGICGCSMLDRDFDQDGFLVCHDGCPNNPLKTSVGLCGCDLPELPGDIDGDGILDCRDDDDDNDGRTDEEEQDDGTDPNDKGSSLRQLGTTVCAEWNGYLGGMYNIMEHVNLSDEALGVQTTIYDILGAAQYSVNFGINPGAQYDLLVHDLNGRVSDSYGQVCSTHSGSPGALDGRMVYYKTASAGRRSPELQHPFEFAFGMSFTNGHKGSQVASLNSCQPSQAEKDAEKPVTNWAQLTNPNPTAQAGTMNFYDIDGMLQKNLRVLLPASSRRDFSGHQFGANLIGLIEWVPDNQQLEFQLRNVRYYFDTTDVTKEVFTTAAQFEGLVGSGHLLSLPLPASTASRIIEISNASDKASSVDVRFYNTDSGSLITGETFILQPRASKHIIADWIYWENEGTVTIQGSQANSIVAVGMFYGRDELGGIRYIYGIPARVPLGSRLRGSYNTYLNQGCWLTATNPTTEAQEVTISMVRGSGASVLENHKETILPNGLLNFDVCSNDSPGNYGVVTLSPKNPNTITGAVIRIGEKDQYRFATDLRQ